MKLQFPLIHDMTETNGFGLPKDPKKLRSELLRQGFDKALAVITHLKMKDPAFQLSEDELNAWGYQLLAQKNSSQALAIFRLNVASYPKSANAYDSLAETLEAR